MGVFVIQDKREDRKYYMASRSKKDDAEQLIKELEEFDQEEGLFLPGQYMISEREYCFHEFANHCGFCTFGICMLEAPEDNCLLMKVLKGKQNDTGTEKTGF